MKSLDGTLFHCSRMNLEWSVQPKKAKAEEGKKKAKRKKNPKKSAKSNKRLKTDNPSTPTRDSSPISSPTPTRDRSPSTPPTKIGVCISNLVKGTTSDQLTKSITTTLLTSHPQAYEPVKSIHLDSASNSALVELNSEEYAHTLVGLSEILYFGQILKVTETTKKDWNTITKTEKCTCCLKFSTEESLLHSVANNQYNLGNFEKNFEVLTSNVTFKVVLSGNSRENLHNSRKKLEEGFALGE